MKVALVKAAQMRMSHGLHIDELYAALVSSVQYESYCPKGIVTAF